MRPDPDPGHVIQPASQPAGRPAGQRTGAPPVRRKIKKIDMLQVANRGRCLYDVRCPVVRRFVPNRPILVQQRWGFSPSSLLVRSRGPVRALRDRYGCMYYSYVAVGVCTHAGCRAASHLMKRGQNFPNRRILFFCTLPSRHAGPRRRFSVSCHWPVRLAIFFFLLCVWVRFRRRRAVDTVG